ncbi:M23 family metallopeptidase [Cyanobacterium sp. uoEpiScrs1]|uniref:M23 family metallopeptidase n=1 Tax=Cyanobacterium sp. uoEpiScrs1 TaxID=2976343 RepID=UPI002269900A|nr:M23 family metallopeptidase [Cyanobacterium sp. uoEpiScrs1]
MNQFSYQTATLAKYTKTNHFLKQSISLISGLSVVSSQLFSTPVNASTNTVVASETRVSSDKLEVVEPSSKKISESFRRIVPNRPATNKPILNPSSVKPATPKIAPKPSVHNRTNGNTITKVQSSIPNILPSTFKKSSAAPVSQPPIHVHSKGIPISPSIATRGKNSYIDFTNYGISPQQSPVSSSSVILTERSTGCQIVSHNSQLLKGNCGSVAKVGVSPAKSTLANHRVNFINRQRKAPPIGPQQVVNLQPITRKQLSVSLESIPKYNRAASLYSHLNSIVHEQSRTDLMYPLPVVASITSAFGWRTHPISGTGRQHSGTDIGAPLGTPVLAAYEGEVSQSDWLGGYGLTVILRHLEGSQESRYAHLSEVYVQPGEWVNQGAVIGRVGSTGYSTGPHLHFEWRHLTNQGWVAVDAGLHLEAALANLIRSVRMAEAAKTLEG